MANLSLEIVGSESFIQLEPKSKLDLAFVLPTMDDVSFTKAKNCVELKKVYKFEAGNWHQWSSFFNSNDRATST